MLEFRTQGFQGYAVKYSPFFDNRLAVAASANYGLVGNGRLYVLELTSNGIQCLKWYVFGRHEHDSPSNRKTGILPKMRFTTSPILRSIRIMYSRLLATDLFVCMMFP